MKYTVSVAIDGRIDVEVEANNFEEAKELAKYAIEDCDLDTMEFVGCKPVNAEDENGMFMDY